MKTAKILLVAALLGLGLAAAAAPASANGYRAGGAHYGGAHYGGAHYGGYYGGHYGGYYGRGWYGGPRVNFSLGYWGPWGGYWGPGYWGPGYWGGPGYGYGYGYYGAPVVVVPSEPRVYVERDEAYSSAPSASGQQQWWYWCASAKGYYPYVSACSEGWQRVPPQPMQAPQ